MFPQRAFPLALLITAAVLLAAPGQLLAQYTTRPFFEGRSIFMSPAPLGYSDGFTGSSLGSYSYRYTSPYLGYYSSGMGRSGWLYQPWAGRYSYYTGRYANGRTRTRARLQVRLPSDSAEVWVEGKKQSTPGAVRTFKSPPLKPGRGYKYTIRASWLRDGRKVTRSRTVVFRAGERVRVDFRLGQKRQRR
jgi:uncharacterized protein (TIGR03000 family)